MPSWPKVLGNGTIGRQEPLGLAWGFEPLQALFSLVCRGREFSARLFTDRCWRCSTPGNPSRLAAP